MKKHIESHLFVAFKNWLKKYKTIIRGLIYSLILITIILFLYQIGNESWVIVMQHHVVALWLMCVFVLAIIVQAQGFRYLYPNLSSALTMKEMIYIWSLSSTLSVVAPFLPGLGTRTALLLKRGQSIGLIASVSLRQVWLGIEYSALLCSMALIGIDAFDRKLVIIVFLFWCSIYGLRKIIQKNGKHVLGSKLKFLITSFNTKSHIFTLLQFSCMSLVYYLVYSEFGVDFTVYQAVVLSSFTVFISLFAFAPNGLGLNDLVWVLVASNGGLSIEASVALAILLRIAHFISVLSVLCVFRVLMNKNLTEE
jgi:uncharacterized membrane protein YbhN (UPF0104 family)